MIEFLEDFLQMQVRVAKQKLRDTNPICIPRIQLINL